MFSLFSRTKKKKYNNEEIDELRKNGKIILVSHKKVYDVTEYIDIHPGSREAITYNMYNQDNKDSYDFHSNNGQKIWDSYYIGEYSKS